MIEIPKKAVLNLYGLLCVMDIEGDEILQIVQDNELRVIVPNAPFQLIWNPERQIWIWTKER